MKKIKLLSVYFLSFLFLLFCNGCKKENKSDISTVSKHINPVKDGPIAPYYFQWDQATYMPSSSSSSANPVPMPWNSGTTAIDANIVNDYKPSDGWVMVYNTFSPNIILNDPNYVYFFSLYNVYRGLIRFYLWQPASAIATTYVNHGLSLYGSNNTSPMLNFNAQEIIDPTKSQSVFSEIQNQQISATGGTWFAFQYEIAYDPNVANTSFPTAGITLAPQWANVSAININGTQTGSIKSTQLAVPNGNVNFGSLLTTGATTFAGAVNYASIFSGAGNPWTSAITSAVAGVVKGFLSAILGGSASDKPINLTINTQLKLTGNMVNNGALTNMKLILPGQSNSQTADGNTPYYNKVLGVFNVTSKPAVQITEDGFDVQITDPYDGSTQYDSGNNVKCWFNPGAVNITWNPDIINSTPTGATIANIRYDLVAILANGPYTNIFSSNQTSGEQVGNLPVAIFTNPTSASPAKFSYYTQYDGNQGAYANTPTLAVRVSFDVVPNNGGTKVTLVKTFDVSNQL